MKVKDGEKVATISLADREEEKEEEEAEATNEE